MPTTSSIKFSSALGTYLATGPARRDQIRGSDSPAWGGAGESVGGQFASIPGGELIGRLAGPGEDEDEALAAGERARGPGYWKRVMRHSLGRGVAGGAAGGISAALLGAYANSNRRQLSQPVNTPAMAAGGAVAGALLHGGTGAVSGVYDALVRKLVSPESLAKADRLKAERPIATALPFGDAYGAVKLRDKPKKKKPSEKEEPKDKDSQTASAKKASVFARVALGMT